MHACMYVCMYVCMYAEKDIGMTHNVVAKASARVKAEARVTAGARTGARARARTHPDPTVHSTITWNRGHLLLVRKASRQTPSSHAKRNTH